MNEGGTLADKIVELLRHFPNGLTDAQIAFQLRVVHQQVHSRCRTLADAGVLKRDDFGRPVMNSLVTASKPVVRASAAHEWHWEGNMQAEIVRWLEMDGWALVREQELIAVRAGRLLHVEAKGFPTKSYSDIKPTHPAVQANHWYSQALLKVLQLRQEHPDDQVALGLPDFACYRELLAGTAATLQAMRIDALVVRSGGGVEHRVYK